VVEVGFAQPIARVYAYLADPRNRPAWQTSLRRIELLGEGPPRVGLTWIDVTSAGARPVMAISEMSPPEDGRATWVEEGTWRRIEARLVLDFRETSSGTLVHAGFTITGPTPLAPVIAVLNRLAPYAVRSDLRRASRLLDTE
jgi:uncharacterized protein YndB with AHSA1/START domain